MEESRNGDCEECKKNASKYTCPGCCLRTCSLPCVNAHKQRTGCNGKRNITSFVPLSKFDDNLLISDYNLLEETKRVAETAERIRSKLCNTTNSSYHPHFKLPYPLRTLRSVAASRKTKLLFLPSGMSRRETNQTLFNHRKKCISWTIEWRFHSTDVVLLDHGVHEDTSLCSLIENHLQPSPWNHPLRQFCEVQLDCLKFFIRKYPKGMSPFRELDIKAPIRQQLADMVVLEYPVIHVYLPSDRYDFEIIKKNLPVNHRRESKDSNIADNEIQKGVTFREEEIKENGSSLDSQVFDLMKHVHQIPPQNKSEKAFGNSVSSLTRTEAGNRVHSSTLAKDSGFFKDMEFHFDQGLLDAYSDLIAEINPDDFLDLEGEFAKQSETDDRRDLLDSRGGFFAEELEEGEIVD
ncbi:HIT-type Zinc finger family protein, putative isoform 2 [Hibiscus syriacus]|uniref:HIT-type Zinc finger family protein, putative isoform 2 n=1 Tax=Hibiscus syriacus TaxID=106335 RepID=A0A6A2YHJ6_HIBSY|nr:box C/D snoRNA protein 1 [Hibiscus syriacus]KAE8679816.1 HIT-type Zinc finger family protein, putative isoform 2 [Hibiscus syriacus]